MKKNKDMLDTKGPIHNESMIPVSEALDSVVIPPTL